jgi:diguanylate cyclase
MIERAVSATAWTWSVCGALAFVVVPGLGGEYAPAVVALAAITCAMALVSRRSAQPVVFVFPLVLSASGFHLVTSGYLGDVVDPHTMTTAGAMIDIGAGVMVLLGIGIALRGRTTLTRRDVLDGLTVLVSGAMVTWITVVNPLTQDRLTSPTIGALSAAHLPLSMLVVGMAVALLLTGLHRNRSMWFLTIAVSLGLLSDVVRGMTRTEVLADSANEVAGAIALTAFMLATAAFIHPSMAEVVDRRRRPDRVRFTVRIAVVAGALVVPIAMIASVSTTSTADRIVRTLGAVILVALGGTRLIEAIRASHDAHNELFDRLHLDDLTRLPNRSMLLTTVADVLDRTWRTEQRPALVQLNLDRFKNINDSLGHDQANEVLQSIAARLTSAAAEFGAMVARPAGDEFVVLDPGVTSSAQALSRTEAIQTALNEPFIVGDSTVFVTASIGLVVVPRNRTIAPEEFLRRADIATHRAKANGRNCIALFDETMQERLNQRMDVENALYGAIDRHEMRLYHQPIVDITNGEISGFEALIRWRRADGTLVPPGDFISIAEETGIINTLGSWAMLEALCELRRWIDDGTVPPSTTMSVNVSPRQVADPHFPDVVQEALARSGVPPHLLWLEVTESMMLSEPELARATLRRVRAMGVRIALDDFGTGYSSLSLLQRFPLQRIKIDRAFVSGVADRSNDRSLVRTIIAMGASLGLDIVAEGVESIHQLSTLRDLGCAKAQGYLISHPIPSEAMRSTMVALQDLSSLSLFGATETGFRPLPDRAVTRALDDRTADAPVAAEHHVEN